MKYLHAVLAFILAFVVVFFIAGLTVKRLLPHMPGMSMNPFALAYWTNNWPGLGLGIVGGVLYALREMRQYGKGARDKAD